MHRTRNWDEHKRQARERFLGKTPVVGVGIQEGDAPRLVFFLERRSSAMERVLREWAEQESIPYAIKVIGQIRPAECLR